MSWSLEMEQHSTKGNRTSSCSTGIDPLSGLDDNRRIHNKHHCGRWYACCKLMVSYVVARGNVRIDNDSVAARTARY
jgi:hypothetical protein